MSNECVYCEPIVGGWNPDSESQSNIKIEHDTYHRKQTEGTMKYVSHADFCEHLDDIGMLADDHRACLTTDRCVAKESDA